MLSLAAVFIFISTLSTPAGTNACYPVYTESIHCIDPGPSNSTLTINCPANHAIKVEQGRIRRAQQPGCVEDMSIYDTSCNIEGIRFWLQSKCNNKRTCTLETGKYSNPVSSDCANHTGHTFIYYFYVCQPERTLSPKALSMSLCSNVNVRGSFLELQSAPDAIYYQYGKPSTTCAVSITIPANTTVLIKPATFGKQHTHCDQHISVEVDGRETLFCNWYSTQLSLPCVDAERTVYIRYNTTDPEEKVYFIVSVLVSHLTSFRVRAGLPWPIPETTTADTTTPAVVTTPTTATAPTTTTTTVETASTTAESSVGPTRTPTPPVNTTSGGPPDRGLFGLSTELVIGVAVGFVVLLLAIIAASAYVCQKRQKKKPSGPYNNDTNSNEYAEPNSLYAAPSYEEPTPTNIRGQFQPPPPYTPTDTLPQGDSITEPDQPPEPPPMGIRGPEPPPMGNRGPEPQPSSRPSEHLSRNQPSEPSRNHNKPQAQRQNSNNPFGPPVNAMFDRHGNPLFASQHGPPPNVIRVNIPQNNAHGHMNFHASQAIGGPAAIRVGPPPAANWVDTTPHHRHSPAAHRQHRPVNAHPGHRSPEPHRHHRGFSPQARRGFRGNRSPSPPRRHHHFDPSARPSSPFAGQHGGRPRDRQAHPSRARSVSPLAKGHRHLGDHIRQADMSPHADLRQQNGVAHNPLFGRNYEQFNF